MQGKTVSGSTRNSHMPGDLMLLSCVSWVTPSVPDPGRATELAASSDMMTD